MRGVSALVWLLVVGACAPITSSDAGIASDAGEEAGPLSDAGGGVDGGEAVDAGGDGGGEIPPGCFSNPHNARMYADTPANSEQETTVFSAEHVSSASSYTLANGQSFEVRSIAYTVDKLAVGDPVRVVLGSVICRVPECDPLLSQMQVYDEQGLFFDYTYGVPVEPSRFVLEEVDEDDLHCPGECGQVKVEASVLTDDGLLSMPIDIETRVVIDGMPFSVMVREAERHTVSPCEARSNGEGVRATLQRIVE